MLLIFLLAIILWFIPHTEEISSQGWQLLTIFITTIFGIILNPFPMGTIAIAAISMTVLTNTLTIEETLEGYKNPAIWLIMASFFISFSFLKTGLGKRIAYLFVLLFGRTSIGLAYSLIGSELILAPSIPSITARSGGIILPIINSLALAFKSYPKDPSSKRLGEFLILTMFQSSIILSAMFLTAMAGNPIACNLAIEMGVTINWSTWALIAILPGSISLLIVPLLIYILCRPKLKKLQDSDIFAKKQLKKMGKISKNEWIMLIVFITLLILWIFGERYYGIHSLTTALLGVTILLITRVISLDELLSQKTAWNTFLWFGALVTLATYLNTFGVIDYCKINISNWVIEKGFGWKLTLLILSLLYFYFHYIFASSIAHISAMYTAFVGVVIQIGAPPLLTALIFAFFNSLFGGLTHYGMGSAPLFYEIGYVEVKKWWLVGFIVSIINIIIWLGVGSFWYFFLNFK